MAFERLTIHVSDGIAKVLMKSPSGVVTADPALVGELSEAFKLCEEDDQVRVIILGSEGKIFCAGGDIDYLAEEVKKEDFTLAAFVEGLARLVCQMKQCPKPVIGAVHGAAAGSGCNLALACDMVIADSRAIFMEAFVNIGLAPDTLGAFILQRQIGQVRAFELLATGRAVGAEEALRLGLINRISQSPESLMPEAEEAAASFVRGPAKAYQGIKEMLFAAAYAGIDAFIDVEADAQHRCEQTDDFRKGLARFLNRKTKKDKQEN